jgi:hypothetical protein
MIGEEGVCECHSYAPSSFSSLRDSAADTKKEFFAPFSVINVRSTF